MNLKQIILASQPDLSSNIFSHVKLSSGTDVSAIKGALGEAYVAHWLSEVPSFEKQYFADDLAKVPKYSYSNSEHGVLVTRDSRPYSEIDGLCRISGINFGCEVKSNKIGNILHKLQRKINVSKEILGGGNCMFTLFFPISLNDKSDICTIEDKYSDNVLCIDSGYGRDGLLNLVKDYKKYLSK